MNQKIIEKDSKEGLISNMGKKYYNPYEKGNYCLDFIPGVEEQDDHNDSENVILTYKK